MIFHSYITGWWLTYPSEKYEFVNGKDDIPYMKWKIKNVRNHHQMIMYHSHTKKNGWWHTSAAENVTRVHMKIHEDCASWCSCGFVQLRFRSIPMPAPTCINPSALTHSNSHPFWMVISVMWWSLYSIQRLLLRSNDHSKSQEVWIHCTLYLQHLSDLSPAAPSRIKFHSRRAVSSWERHQQDLWRMPKTRGVIHILCCIEKSTSTVVLCLHFSKGKTWHLFQDC